MRVLYVSCASKVKPSTFVCRAMCSTVMFIIRPRLFLYYAWSGVNRVQVILSGFSEIFFFPGKNCMWVWLYEFLGCTRACMCRGDGDLICVGHDLNR